MTEKSGMAVSEFLKSIKVGEKEHKDGLSIFPLLTDIKSDYDYITLDEALMAGTLKVTEIGSGTVPEIKVLNSGKKDVFIMDGEELVGARQNRIVNISLIVPAESVIDIPVSCVEHGRWRQATEKFHSSQNISYANLRRQQKEAVMDSMKEEDSFRGNQSRVWNNIEVQICKMCVTSPTSAMSDIYEKEKIRINNYKDIFKLVDGQVGAVFAIGGDIFGMDLFGKEDTCKKLMPKIINSYVMEILLENQTGKQPERKDTEAFIAGVSESVFSEKKSPGKGMTVSISGKTASGTSLVAEDTVVHTAVFKNPEDKQQTYKTEYERLVYMDQPSRRRDNIIR